MEGGRGQGHQQSLPRLDPEVDAPAIKLVGYWTSCKEIRDLYHDIYLLRRSNSPPPCRPQQRKEATQDILSSLRSHLHRWGFTTMLEEDQQGAATATPYQSASGSPDLGPGRGKTCTMRPSKRPERLTSGHWRLPTCWNIILRGLSQGVEGAQYQCSHGCSSSHPWSRSLGRCERSLDKHERSLDRHERSSSWHRLKRWVTFWDPEVESDSSERPYRGPQGHSFRTHLEGSDGVPPPIWRQETVHPQKIPTAYPDVGSGRGYLPKPSIRNYEVWLDWQACQLDMLHWWVELTAIPNVENPKRLAQKICASFLILAVRCKALPGQDYTAPPAPQMSHQG